MRAVEIHNDEKKRRLRPCQRSIPTPKNGEVLIRVHAAGVNRADLLQVKGLYPPPEGASDLPGLEVSGTVAQLGDGVTGFSVGDAVCALLSGGGYAEYATAPVGQVLPIPQSVNMLGAASLPEACFTVWKNLFVLAKLQAGERVLVHAGASGIGVAAIQMAAALGATVYTTAGSDEKCRACEALGAIQAINYNQNDYVSVIKTHTQDKGVDVILDVLGGGEDFQKNLSILAYRGRMATIALLRGKNASVNLAPFLLKNLTLFASTLRSDTQEEKVILAKGLLTQIWPFYVQGKIKPVVDSVFPLEEAEAAHQYMESRRHIGKIILQVV